VPYDPWLSFVCENGKQMTFRGSRKPVYLHFMLGSTSRRSLKPIPHGFPGVASSINLPNSGWKTGAGFSFALPWSVQSHNTRVYGLTRHLRYADQVLLRPAAVVSRRWPTQLGYLPGEATIGPCDCPDHSRQPNTQSARGSVLRCTTDQKRLVIYLISPK
jgi:hypothetical protein